MSFSTIVKSIVEEESKKIHVAFIAKILSVNGDKAKIQPLGLIRDYGGTAKKQTPITNVHIAESAKYKITSQNITYVYDSKGNKKTQAVAVPIPIAKNDIVLCVCCDRNIAAALKGENSLPPVGYHNQSDCVIVSII